MATINHLEGYAFAKKKGDKIYLFEGPHTLSDYLPVIAEGTDVPRMLKDRFADVVNVKDFGARGDGEHDDTEAFEAAAATGKTVFVPGVYKVFRYVSGRFRSLPQTVSIIGSTTYAFSETDNDSFKKDIVYVGKATLPLYSFAKSRWGNGMKISLQGISTDESFNFYIVFSIDIKETNATDKMFLVAKFSNGFEYIGCAAFESDKFVEQIVVRGENLIFSGSSKELYYYPITEETWNDSVNTADNAVKKNVGNQYFDNDFQLYYCGGEYFNSCRSSFHGSQNGNVSRDYIFSFNADTLEEQGVVRFDYPDVGWSGDQGDVNTETRKAFPKRQSFCVTDDSFIFAVGGYWSASFPDYERYRIQGIKVFTRKGDLTKSLLLWPRALRTKLQSLGIAAQYVEQEGVTEKDGQVFSIMATGADDCFVVFREFSGSASAVDFSDCKAEETASSPVKLFNNLPLFNLLPKNPYTGELFNSLAEVLVFLRDTTTYQVSFTIYSGSSFDFSGLGFSGTTVTIIITNRYGNGFVINYTTTDYRGNGSVFATLSAQNVASFAPISFRSSNLQLTNKNDFLGVNGRIYFDDGTNKLLVAMVVHGDSQDTIEYGGNSSVMNSATSHGFFVSSNGQPGEKTGLGVIKIDYRGLWPYATNSFSSGIASRLWSQVYAASGSINTSDERAKQDISDPQDAVLKAMQNVDFRVFRFKDSVEKKGESARIHAGVIAQEVQAAFAAQGLNAADYGLFCYDEWGDEYETVEIIDQPEVLGENGEIVTPAVTHTERRKVLDAGDRYGIRYTELLALTCASLAKRLEKIEKALTVNRIDVGD